MKLNVKVDYSGNALSAGIRQSTRAAETIVTTQVLKDMRKRMPARTMTLQKLTHIERGHIVVIPGPYARYLNAGKVMVDENGRGPFPTPDGPRFHKGAVLHPIDRDLVISKAVNRNATSHFVEITIKQDRKKWEEVARRAVLNNL